MFDSSLLILTGVLPVTAQDPTPMASIVLPDDILLPPHPSRLANDDAQSFVLPDDHTPVPPPRLTLDNAQSFVWPDDLTPPPPPR